MAIGPTSLAADANELGQSRLRALIDLLFARGMVVSPSGGQTRRIGDGHSNFTYLVESDSSKFVVRWAPTSAGYDVLREARVIAALDGSGVAVPKVLAMVEAGVWDVPFFVMSHVDGVVVTAATPKPFANPEQRRLISVDMIDVLATLHSVDWRAAGLRGRPEGFNARHLDRIASLIMDGRGDLPAAFRVTYRWLRARVPVESGASILHNDFRLGNVMLAPDQPGRVAAVLDWELSTVGDPMFDLGYLLASTPDSASPLTPLHEMGAALSEPGYLTRPQLVERYAAATGKAALNLSWHTAFANWKLAALFELGHRRYLSGERDEQYRDRTGVQAFLAAASAEIER